MDKTEMLQKLVKLMVEGCVMAVTAKARTTGHGESDSFVSLSDAVSAIEQYGGVVLEMVETLGEGV